MPDVRHPVYYSWSAPAVQSAIILIRCDLDGLPQGNQTRIVLYLQLQIPIIVYGVLLLSLFIA